MPTVEIWGENPGTIEEMDNDIVKVIEDIPELKIKGKGWVKIIYPTHRSNNNTIVVKITILKDPDRTLKVRNKLAEQVAMSIQNYYPKRKIQCSVYSLTHDQGSCSLEPRT